MLSLSHQSLQLFFQYFCMIFYQILVGEKTIVVAI